MNILYFYMDYYYYPSMDSFRESLSKIANVEFIKSVKKGKVTDVSKLKNEYDVIVLGVHSVNYQYVDGLDKVDCVKAMMCDDMHSWFDKHIDYINKNKVDIVLPTKTGFETQFCSMIKHHCITYPFPFPVNAGIFRDYGLERKWDVFLSGFIGGSVYPVRQRLEDVLSKTKWIKARFRHGFDLSVEEYAKEIAQSKIIIFGNGIYDYLNMRVFQGWASKTLVMCPMPKDAECVLKRDYNFVEITKYNFLSKIQYYILNPKERQWIVDQAYKDVYFHTTDYQSRQLVRTISDMMEYKKV